MCSDFVAETHLPTRAVSSGPRNLHWYQSHHLPVQLCPGSPVEHTGLQPPERNKPSLCTVLILSRFSQANEQLTWMDWGRLDCSTTQQLSKISPLVYTLSVRSVIPLSSGASLLYRFAYLNCVCGFSTDGEYERLSHKIVSDEIPRQRFLAWYMYF